MANRYWVGGAGTWDGSTTTHWAATSGGAGGASAPTTADDVILDASSGAVVVSMDTAGTAACRSLDSTNFTGTLGWQNSAAATLKIGDASGGALTIGAGVTIANILSSTNAIQFLSTSDNGGAGWPIRTNGKTMPSLTFGGGAGNVTGGKWVLQDDLTWTNQGTGQLALAGGTLDTNDRTLVGWAISLNGSLARAFLMRSSTITLSAAATNAWLSNSITNLTVTPGTSTVVITGATATMQTSTLTLYNLSFTGSGLQRIFVSGGVTLTVNNLTRTGVVGSRIDEFKVGAGYTGVGRIVVNGTLTITGDSAVNRMWAWGTDVNGLAGTAAIIQAAAVSLSNTDFRDITITGAAAPASGTSLGDGLGNSGITFPASLTRYWVGSTGLYGDTAHWSTASGGAGGASMPLPQDDVNFDASSGSGIVNFQIQRLGRNVNFTGFTGTMDTSGAGAVSSHYVFGNITLGAGMTLNGGNSLQLAGRGSHTITSNGRSFAPVPIIEAPGGTYTLADDLIVAVAQTGGFTVTFGTFDANGKNVTAFRFTFGALVGGATCTVKMGSGTWSATTTGSTYAISASNLLNLTLQAQTSTLLISSLVVSAIRKQMALQGVTLNIVRHSGYGTIQFVNTGSTINQLIIDPPTRTVPRSLELNSNTQLTLGSITCDGIDGQPIAIASSVAGSRAPGLVMAAGNQPVLRGVTIIDMAFSGGAAWSAQRVRDLGNNSGISFGRTPAAVRSASAARTVAAARSVRT